MIQLSSTGEWLLVLAAFAGAVHVLSPDHWIPISLTGWQRQWRLSHTILFAIAALLLHIGAGFAIYALFSGLIERMDPDRFFLFAVSLVVGAASLRAARFSRIYEVLTANHGWIARISRVLLFLGPCESIIPIFLKARHLGMGYLSAFSAFTFGTLLAGTLLLVTGPWLWNHPLRFSHFLRAMMQRRVALPVAAGVTFGLLLVLRLA